MKKRTCYLLVLSAATAAAVCFGAWNYLGTPLITLTKDQFGLTFKSRDTTTIRHETGAFDTIRLDLTNTDIRIQAGDDYSVTWQGPKQNCPSFRVKNGVLTAAESTSKKHAIFNSDKITTVTVPRDLNDLKDVSLASDNGDLTIAPDHTITLSTLDLNSENGDIDLSGCSGTTITANTENGDISVSPADSLKNYTVSVDTGSGDVRIGNNSYSPDDDHSSIQVGNGLQKLSLHTENGDIDVQDP